MLTPCLIQAIFLLLAVMSDSLSFPGASPDRGATSRHRLGVDIGLWLGLLLQRCLTMRVRTRLPLHRILLGDASLCLRGVHEGQRRPACMFSLSSSRVRLYSPALTTMRPLFSFPLYLGGEHTPRV